MSLLLPTFLQRLAEPAIKTVMLSGCGGGFDFVHSLLLYPELMRLGKRVIIGSYSFGDPALIGGETETVLDDNGLLVRRVSARSVAAPSYGPEVHLCSYLDARFPERALHTVYAYYARAFSVARLERFYAALAEQHEIDAWILVDGGSDSLMVGDEAGLGDPIEDAVSLAAVTALSRPMLKLLITTGLGVDRFNDVSDASTLRAVAELTRHGGYLGAVGLETTSPGFEVYKGCVEHIHERQRFRSVVAGSILSAGRGEFGSEVLPPELAERASTDTIYLWPLMAMLWGFDVDAVARRSRIVEWVRNCESQLIAHAAVADARRHLETGVRAVEDLPRHEDVRRARRRSDD